MLTRPAVLQPTYRNSRARSWVVCLVLAALALRCTIPTGFMPASGSDAGMAWLELCAGDARSVQILRSLETHAHHEGGHGTHAMPVFCDFGVLVTPISLGMAPDAETLPLLRSVTHARRLRTDYAAPFPRQGYARAPPILLQYA